MSDQSSTPQGRVEIVRANDRWRVTPHTEAGSTLHYTYEALSYPMTEKAMMPYLLEIPVDTLLPTEASSHGGEEFLFVLTGQIEITMNSQSYVLDQGDSIYFDAQQPHTLRAKGSRTAQLILCLVHLKKSDLVNPIMRAY